MSKIIAIIALSFAAFAALPASAQSDNAIVKACVDQIGKENGFARNAGIFFIDACVRNGGK